MPAVFFKPSGFIFYTATLKGEAGEASEEFEFQH